MNAIKSIKKINIILIVLILLLLVIIFVLLTNNNVNKVVISNESNSKNNIINSNALTMMYETASGSGEYVVSSDISWPQEGYIFNAELSSCENGSKITWDDENKKVLMQANTSDKCYVYFDVYEPTLAELCTEKAFATCIKEEVYTRDGENGLYCHDGIGSYENADLEAGDNSYRYSGDNPNNYVCFGSDGEVCPEDNLYRIIGVFGNQVKLIKVTSIGSYQWCGPSGCSSGNTWSGTSLNTTVLNNTFHNSLNSLWQNKITNYTWIVGGNSSGNIMYTVKSTYKYEIVSPAESTTYPAKIGLMYVSDYGYAASPENWADKISRNNNWMYLGDVEWTITRNSDGTISAYAVSGGVSNPVIANLYAAARPVFYLNSDVQYISGSGTQSDPFRIA